MKLIVYVFLLTAVMAAQRAGAQAVAEAEGKKIGPGVTWRNEKVAAGPLNYNVMRVQLDNPHVTIEAESAHDKLFVGEKTHQTAKREAVPGQTEIIGAINGDFFGLGNFFPVGLLVADGMIYDMPSQYRSAFVLTKDETPYIGPVSLNVSVEIEDKSVKVDRINSGTKSDSSIVLFTPPYGSEVGPAPGTRFKFSMQGKEFLPNQPLPVSIAKVDAGSSTPLLVQEMILHIPPGQLEKASVLMGRVTKGILSADLPEVSGVVASVIGGGPAIVVDGQVDVRHVEEKMEESHLQKHPRTAVGFTKDKKTVYMVTVDGRQPRLSVGVTFDELAGYMQKLGCWSALNLDGGGSTSMVINGKVVNHPSDLMGPRSVANSLLVVATIGNGSETSATAFGDGKSTAAPESRAKQY